MPSVSVYGRVKKRIFNPGRSKPSPNPNPHPRRPPSFEWRLNATIQKKRNKFRLVKVKVTDEQTVGEFVLLDQRKLGWLIVVGTRMGVGIISLVEEGSPTVGKIFQCSLETIKYEEEPNSYSHL